jgi:hypothetical protein
MFPVRTAGEQSPTPRKGVPRPGGSPHPQIRVGSTDPPGSEWRTETQGQARWHASTPDPDPDPDRPQSAQSCEPRGPAPSAPSLTSASSSRSAHRPPGPRAISAPRAPRLPAPRPALRPRLAAQLQVWPPGQNAAGGAQGGPRGVGTPPRGRRRPRARPVARAPGTVTSPAWGPWLANPAPPGPTSGDILPDTLLRQWPGAEGLPVTRGAPVRGRTWLWRAEICHQARDRTTWPRA